MSSLRVNSIWMLCGTVAASASQWLIMVIIAKEFGVISMGAYALSVSVVSPVFSFSSLSLRAVQASDQLRNYGFLDYLITRLTTSFFSLLFVFGLCLLWPWGSLPSGVVIGVTVLKLSEAITDISHGKLQQVEKISLIGKSLIVGNIVIISFFSFSVFVGLGMSASLVLASLMALFYSIVVDLMLAWKTESSMPSIKASRENLYTRIFQIISISYPLGITVLMNSAVTHITRVILSIYSSVSLVGIFAALSQFIMVGSTLVGAVSQASLPRLARHVQAREKVAFSNILMKLVVVAILVGISGILVSHVLGEQVLLIFYNPEVANYSSTLTLIMVSSSVAYIAGVLGTAITSARMFKATAINSTVCTTVTVLFALALIPWYGILGAVLSIAAGYVSQLLLALFFISKIYRK